MLLTMTARQLKNRFVSALLLSTIASTLVGCTGGETRRDTPWVWTEPSRTAWQPEPAERNSFYNEPDTHNASIAVFSHSASITGTEFARRDNIMGVRSVDALPDRLGWPREKRPSLNQTRTIRTSISAEQWIYPSQRRDYGNRRRSNGRGW